MKRLARVYRELKAIGQFFLKNPERNALHDVRRTSNEHQKQSASGIK